nr:MAG TPA: hypothetical protein [Caudoviricetes sp.]
MSKSLLGVHQHTGQPRRSRKHPASAARTLRYRLWRSATKIFSPYWQKNAL